MNPVYKLRVRLGLSATQMALVLCCSLTTVQAVESGACSKLPKRYRAGLAKLGYDPELVAEEYLQWRLMVGNNLSNQVQMSK